MRGISRRKALKLILAATAAAALTPRFHARAAYPYPPDPNSEEEEVTGPPSTRDYEAYLNSWVRVGRAIHTVTFYDTPSTGGTRTATRRRDQSFVILGETRAPFSAHNDLWYKTSLGYVHSAWVLPIRLYPPQPFIRDVGEWGFWGEISQVYTEAYAEPDTHARKVYRFYGGNVFHVIASYEDDAGTGWYQVYDEFPPTNPTSQWVLARDVRRIPRSEMAPIRPFAGRKRIEVSIEEQRLRCFEGETVVFTTLVASGLPGQTATPTGEMAVLLKQPSRHMSNHPYPGGPPPLGDLFDLPGIPWNLFFDLSGTAIHGAYWHNDFGIRRSHGCLNVSQEAARWIYRWAYPIGGFEDDFIQGDRVVGTPVIIY